MMQFPFQKNFLEETDQSWRKDHAHANVQKINNRKWFLGPIGGL